MANYNKFRRLGLSMLSLPCLQDIRNARCITPLQNKLHFFQFHHLKHTNILTVAAKTQNLRRSETLSARNYGSHFDNWMELSYEDLVALIESGDVQLIDVREEREIQDQGSFPGAINIPLGGLKEALLMKHREYIEKYRTSKPEIHDSNLVFVGFGPVKSTAALEIARKVGYKKARHFAGGYEEWQEKQKTS